MTGTTSSSKYGTLENINENTHWSELTWWLDDHRVGLYYDYSKKCVKLDMSNAAVKELPRNIMGCLRNNRKDLERFLKETDMIREKKAFTEGL